MKHISEPMVVVAIVALLVMAFMGRAIFRLISMALLIGMVFVAYYVYKHDHSNVIGQIHNLVNQHLPFPKVG